MTMEEISQRAERLYPDNPEYWSVYTAAARDQQQIDTDKACQLVCRLCEKCGQCPHTDCPTLVDCRKAMEELDICCDRFGINNGS